MNDKIYSFDPVADHGAEILLLGSMPGKNSLAANQYYAHKRNAFWSIMGAVFSFDTNTEYEERCRMLVKNRIALWDVLAECERKSSLDSDIIERTIVPNDFAAFFESHPLIACILFNGAKAEQSFKKYVVPVLDSRWAGLPSVRLTSTSPANASYTIVQKTAIWQQVFDQYQPNH